MYEFLWNIQQMAWILLLKRSFTDSYEIWEYLDYVENSILYEQANFWPIATSNFQVIAKKKLNSIEQ